MKNEKPANDKEEQGFDSRQHTADVLKEKGLFEFVRSLGATFGRLQAVIVMDDKGEIIAAHPPIAGTNKH